MKVLWCWRCRRQVPMLDDDEWAVLVEAHRASDEDGRMAVIERERTRRGLPALLPLSAHATAEQCRLRHLTAGYEMFTGVPEADPDAVWHHVASEHGPPCPNCERPIRNARADHCPACGTPLDPEPTPD